MKTNVKYALGLIGLFIIVANGPKFAVAAKGGGAAASGVVKTLQGR